MLESIDLEKSYRKKKVVNKVSLSVKRGEVVGLLGPNGAGKTTIFKIMVGFLKPDSGSILLDEKDITRKDVSQRAILGITYLSQESSVFRGMRVDDNIISVLELRGYRRADAIKKSWELIEDFGLRGKEKQYAWTLSGGEKRRLELARALSINPSYILLDEPFTGIDPIMISDFKDTVKFLAQKNVGILISDHNVRDTLSICTKAYIINNGEIIAEGEPEELVEMEEVKRNYLGEDFKL